MLMLAMLGLLQAPSLPATIISHTTPITKSPIIFKNRQPTFIAFAVNGENNDDNKKPPITEQNAGQKDTAEFVNEDDLKGDGEPPKMFFNMKLGDLLNPDPDNIVAIGLTGVLAWASAQVIWQLFFISFAILGAALKYSFIAALLLFILIALL